MVGRVQVEAHHIAHLFDKEGIGGELETLAAVRCKRGVLAGCTGWFGSAMLCSWRKQCFRVACRSRLLVDGGVPRSVA